MHLSVHPPLGKVRIAAPSSMSLDTLRVFAISKLAWIKQQQKKLVNQPRETAREFLDRESHYLWGKRYLLKVTEADRVPKVTLAHSQICLRVRSGATREKKHEMVAQWYRGQLRAAVAPLIAKWVPLIGVTVDRIFVQQMKTKWGSCNRSGRCIRLNTELAKKPRECLEYLVVHELAHLIEPTHNVRFIALMDEFMPNWRLRREQLNQLPVSHAEWEY